MGKQYLFLFILLLSSIAGVSQIRVTKLVIKPHQIYEIGQSDILVADTLVMMDSSRLVLNQLKPENYIRAQIAIFGNNCVIEGKGIKGQDGRDGRNGDTPLGPCRDGGDARNGGRGLDGGTGVNLYLYFEELINKNKLIVDLTGGNGGNGGNGGIGGGGGPGTVHCKGGNAGNGGNGGDGGNGGRGGVLTISCTLCNDVRSLVSQHFIVRTGGGGFGYGGRAGYAGGPGISPTRNNGTKGAVGTDGTNGKSGEKGALNFDIN
jgi:hypothetical protein